MEMRERKCFKKENWIFERNAGWEKGTLEVYQTRLNVVFYNTNNKFNYQTIPASCAYLAQENYHDAAEKYLVFEFPDYPRSVKEISEAPGDEVKELVEEEEDGQDDIENGNKG